MSRALAEVDAAFDRLFPAITSPDGLEVVDGTDVLKQNADLELTTEQLAEGHQCAQRG